MIRSRWCKDRAALALVGQHAIEQGKRVTWHRLEDLGGLIRAHRPDDTVSKIIAEILRADLIIIDDIGLLPLADEAVEGLYLLIDAGYEKRSIV